MLLRRHKINAVRSGEPDNKEDARQEEIYGDELNYKESPYDEKKEDSKLTKTDINRMPVDELRKMAMNTGVERAESMTGSELKKYLIDIFGL